MNSIRRHVASTTALDRSAAVPFVIPSEAEGSAVHSAFATKVRSKNKFVIPTGEIMGLRPISANLTWRLPKSEKTLVFWISKSPQSRHPESL